MEIFMTKIFNIYKGKKKLGKFTNNLYLCFLLKKVKSKTTRATCALVNLTIKQKLILKDT